MKEVIISVIFNVGVAVLLKIFNNKTSKPENLFQIITYNYVFSAIFCYLIYKPDVLNLNYSKAPWLIYAAMSILMPTVFILIGKSIKYVGIARTDIAQRISLLLTLLASFFLFNEAFSWEKVIGLMLGFISIFFIFSSNGKKTENSSGKWYFPILIFFGMGVISILYKMIAANTEFNFTTSSFIIFIGSFIVGLLIIVSQKQKFSFSAVLWGLGVGFFNFGNVLFYLMAHQTLKNNPSIVFASMNLGVIILGSIVGIWFFKEEMNKWNYLGLGMALAAIGIITLLG